MRGAAILLAAAAALAPAAAADSTPAVDFELALSSQQPGTPTGAELRIRYKNPADPNAKPSPLRTLTLYAPPGTRFDSAALPACTASDLELRLLGPSACPAATRVGDGTLTAITGLGAPVDPVATEGGIFNTGAGVVEVFAFKGTSIGAGWDRVSFTTPDTLEAHPPRTPGAPPDFETSVREIHLVYARVIGPGGKPFITTPPACPASGRWTSRIRFSTKDGASHEAASTTACTPPPPSVRTKAKCKCARGKRGRRCRKRRPRCAKARPGLSVRRAAASA